MTRDRKKNFISCVERTIAQLEQENQKMRETLKMQVQNHENTAPTSKRLNQTSMPLDEVRLSSSIIQPLNWLIDWLWRTKQNYYLREVH